MLCTKKRKTCCAPQKKGRCAVHQERRRRAVHQKKKKTCCAPKKEEDVLCTKEKKTCSTPPKRRKTCCAPEKKKKTCCAQKKKKTCSTPPKRRKTCCTGRVLVGKSKSVVHEDSVASRIDCVTINELLLAQRHKIARVDPPEHSWLSGHVIAEECCRSEITTVPGIWSTHQILRIEHLLSEFWDKQRARSKRCETSDEEVQVKEKGHC